MTTQGNTPNTGQYAQFSGIVQSKLWSAIKGRVSDDELQALNENPEGIMLRLRNGLTKTPQGLVVPSSPFFADEERPSNYGYPQGYKVKPVAEQLWVLSEHFPMLRTDYAIDNSWKLHALPPGAEGFFVAPDWRKVAKTYGEACEYVFRALASTRKFHNYREGQLGSKYLQQIERTEVAFAMLAQQQKSNYLIFPGQFGLLHQGKSVRRARIVYQPHEFGLGAFAIGCMLLSHPNRLQSDGDLYMDCPGDMFAPLADGGFVSAPSFGWCDGGVEFSTNWVGDAFAYYGSASGFMPQ